MEEFRLGVQKCRKTIQDGVRNDHVFQGKAIQAKLLEFIDEIIKILCKEYSFDMLNPPL